jgi:hypothetical protein
MPPDVECHCFYGDIQIRVTVGLAGLPLLDHTASFGDLAVPAHSAREIPGAAATPHPYVTGFNLDFTLRVGPSPADTRSLAAFLPETSHAKLLSNPAVQGAVLALLND